MQAATTGCSDMESVYFNCILNNPTITTVGNFAYTFKCDVTCDAPWAWEYPKSASYGPFDVEGTFTFNNISDDNYYMLPTFTVTLSSACLVSLCVSNVV